MRFTGRQRLRRASEFEAVRNRGQRMACEPFIVQIMPHPDVDEASGVLRRLGVIASRRVGPAVCRNRAKRLIREIFRLNQDVLPSRCDVVMIVRKKISQYSFQQLQENFRRLCKRVDRSKKPFLHDNPSQ